MEASDKLICNVDEDDVCCCCCCCGRLSEQKHGKLNGQRKDESLRRPLGSSLPSSPLRSFSHSSAPAPV